MTKFNWNSFEFEISSEITVNNVIDAYCGPFYNPSVIINDYYSNLPKTNILITVYQNTMDYQSHLSETML